MSIHKEDVVVGAFVEGGFHKDWFYKITSVCKPNKVGTIFHRLQPYQKSNGHPNGSWETRHANELCDSFVLSKHRPKTFKDREEKYMNKSGSEVNLFEEF